MSVQYPDGDKLFISQTLSSRSVNPYLETVIHQAIYCNCDNVNVIVHHHAPNMIPFVATDTEIKPVFHLAVLFHEGVPTFSDYDTKMDPLIVTEDEGNRWLGHSVIAGATA